MKPAYDAGNVFARILRGDLPAKVVFEDERCLAFHDVAPQAPTHVLIIPKQPLANLDDAKLHDAPLLGHLLWVASEVARELEVDDAYRVVINCGAEAGQSVFHLHLHLLAGRQFDWPPG